MSPRFNIEILGFMLIYIVVLGFMPIPKFLEQKPDTHKEFVFQAPTFMNSKLLNHSILFLNQ